MMPTRLHLQLPPANSGWNGVIQSETVLIACALLVLRNRSRWRSCPTTACCCLLRRSIARRMVRQSSPSLSIRRASERNICGRSSLNRVIVNSLQTISDRHRVVGCTCMACPARHLTRSLSLLVCNCLLSPTQMSHLLWLPADCHVTELTFVPLFVKHSKQVRCA